jgi:formylglycine-generating enzyme required for sulfatase activity
MTQPSTSLKVLLYGAAGLVIVLLLLWVFPGIFKQVTQTPVPLNVMVENSTQYAQEQAINQSMSQTAVMQTVRAPVTQTAAMEETLQHPPTPTLQFPTIIALPTEIIDPGNIRMVYVPGDNFVIGSELDTTGESPVHTLYVKPFYIDKYEVTNGLYRVCVDVGVCGPPKNVSSQTHPAYYGNMEFNNYPVVNVDWNMAKQYCEWRGARLPTEAEWEKAARSIDGRTYPWGEEAGCAFANYADVSGACVGDTNAVGAYQDGRSLYGAFDMAGNVEEWVNSLYWVYPYAAADGRESTTTKGLRVVRGGGWGSPLDEITTYYRSGIDPSAYDLYTGFRCAHNAGL